VDLGVFINIITLETCALLGINTLKQIPSILDLADISMVNTEGTLYDIIIFMDFWEYLVEFLVLNLINKLEVHPLILGTPWLATLDVYIGSQTVIMTISKGISIKNLILYLPAKPNMSSDNLKWLPLEYKEGRLRSPLTIDKALIFKRQIED